MTLLGTSLDETLGSAENRYFGRGYLRSRYYITNLEATAASGAVEATAVARVSDWRRPGDVRETHLTTPDALTIAVRIANAIVNRVTGRPAGSGNVVRSVTVRAGGQSNPQSGDISCQATGEFHALSTTSPIASFRVRVGVLQCEVEFCGLAGDAPLAFQEGAWAMARVASSDDYWVDGPERPVLDLRNVTYDARAKTAACDVVASPSRVEGHRLDALDCLVITSQLAQVALLREADVKKSEVGNLWMRRCKLSATEGAKLSQESDIVASTHIEKLEKVQLRGLPWLLAAVSFAPLVGIVGQASLALCLSS